MNTKILDALTMDMDAILFWANEDKIVPITVQIAPKEIAVECRACNTEYTGKYCPNCGYDNA